LAKGPKKKKSDKKGTETGAAWKKMIKRVALRGIKSGCLVVVRRAKRDRSTPLCPNAKTSEPSKLQKGKAESRTGRRRDERKSIGQRENILANPQNTSQGNQKEKEESGATRVDKGQGTD